MCAVWVGEPKRMNSMLLASSAEDYQAQTIARGVMSRGMAIARLAPSCSYALEVMMWLCRHQVCEEDRRPQPEGRGPGDTC